MIKRKRTPQDKKALSYVKDRRNVYAEMRSIAHRAISKRKAMASQALRVANRVTLEKEIHRGNSAEDVDAFVAPTGHKSWRKLRDAPLANYIETKLRRSGPGGKAPKVKGSAIFSKARRKTRQRTGW